MRVNYKYFRHATNFLPCELMKKKRRINKKMRYITLREKENPFTQREELWEVPG